MRERSLPIGLVVMTAFVVGAGVLACDAGEEDLREERVVSSPPAASPEGEDEAIVPSSCLASTNAIDVAVCPRMIDAGCETARRAGTNELCRRLYLDLTGIAPTTAEISSTCAGKDARAIASHLMQQSPATYVRHAKERWAEILAYDPAQVDGKWLADADVIVASMVTGQIGYDDFAKRIVAHPVMGIGARLPRSDVLEDDVVFYTQVAERVMRIFLGRPPIAGESESFAKLFRPWRKRIDVLNGDYGRAEVLLDPSLCPAVTGCESTVLGKTTRINLPLSRTTPTPFEEIPSEQKEAVRAELEKPGALLVQAAPFYTQAVDLALKMYLGWWKDTASLDASLLPEVQVALSKRLRASRSWPELVLDIVTSTLYVRSNRSSAGTAVATTTTTTTTTIGEDVPAWCAGPLRVMRPEAFVSSLGHLLGVRVGRCDHRTYEGRGSYYANGSEGAFFPYALREDEDSDASLFDTLDYHLTAASTIGGCVAGAPRTESPTLMLTFGAPNVAATICNAATSSSSSTFLSALGVPPPSSSSSQSPSPSSASATEVRTIGDRAAQLLLGRALTSIEHAALAQDIDASCVSGDAACDAKHAAALACTALARSIEFGTY